jgi:hypothetical protein
MRRREPRGVVRPARPEAHRVLPVRLVIAARVVVAAAAAAVTLAETADRVRPAEIATIEIGRRVRR